MLFVTCRPFNKVRLVLFWGILAAMVGAIALLGNTLFGMVTLDFSTVLILGVFMLLSPSAFYAITKAIEKLNEKWHEWRDKSE